MDQEEMERLRLDTLVSKLVRNVRDICGWHSVERDNDLARVIELTLRKFKVFQPTVEV